MTIRLICFFLLISYFSFSQTNSEELSVLFYNVENLFDADDNTETNDDEFVPGGERYWNNYRLNEKLLNISKVILNSSGWELPGIVALCEIENRKVLEKMVRFTPLKSANYKIIHKESPDHRGIDVALLYKSNSFFPLNYSHFPLIDAKGNIKNTREILYVSGIWNKKDTLHFFVNHWPSRYLGLLETRPDRNSAARLLKTKIDEITLVNPSSKIIVLGDFNDQPFDESMTNILHAKSTDEKIVENQLYNLSYSWINPNSGTHKYQSQWSVYDQIIVSGSLLSSKKGLNTSVENAKIVNLPFLLEKDEKFGGLKPKRTYIGYSYQNGFSDHLPILLRLFQTN